MTPSPALAALVVLVLLLIAVGLMKVNASIAV